MKKSIYVILLSSTLWAFPSFAYIAGKKQVHDQNIFCPEQIICTKWADITSCMHNGSNSQYWSSIQGPVAGLAKYPYKFSKVLSGYHKTAYVMCYYTQKETASEMYLPSKIESNLKANHDSTRNWVSPHSSVADYSCFSDASQSCPLREAPGLGIIYSNMSPLNPIRILANNVELIIKYYPLNQIFIAYENTSHCLSQKECKIDLEMFNYNNRFVPLGSLIVDMDNNMKIIRVNPSELSSIEIKKIERFNTVKIENTAPPEGESSVTQTSDGANPTEAIKLRELVTFISHHEYSVINRGNHPRKFTVCFSQNARYSTERTYIRKQRECINFMLSPGESKRDRYDLFFPIQYNKEGWTSLSEVTELYGDNYNKSASSVSFYVK